MVLDQPYGPVINVFGGTVLVSREQWIICLIIDSRDCCRRHPRVASANRRCGLEYTVSGSHSVNRRAVRPRYQVL